METANETILVCVQVESTAGVENVEEICAVPGVGTHIVHLNLLREIQLSRLVLFFLMPASDMLFIGPNDLALSVLGYVPARGDEPEYVDAIERIVGAARRHGKWVGRLSNDGASCREHLNVFDTVAMGYDARALHQWYTTELRDARAGHNSFHTKA